MAWNFPGVARRSVSAPVLCWMELFRRPPVGLIIGAVVAESLAIADWAEQFEALLKVLGNLLMAVSERCTEVGVAVYSLRKKTVGMLGSYE